MTKTTFENKVTMGNVIQLVVMMAIVIGGYTELRTRQGQQAEAIAAVGAQVTSNEGRIRAVEQSSAVTTTRYESLAQTMGEVKAELRQTNELLRRVLETPAR